jgi:hypothetical protein
MFGERTLSLTDINVFVVIGLTATQHFSVKMNSNPARLISVRFNWVQCQRVSAMSQAQHSQSLQRDRGMIDCFKCHSPIFIDHPGNVAIEFSVPCPKCGHRGMYFRRMMRGENESNERRQTPRE